MTTTTPALRVCGLSKRYGSLRALDEVSFDVPERAVFGLLGPNGAGKTTLFSIVADFVRADRGRVEVRGTDVRAVDELLGRLSILPQDALFERNVPVWDQLVYFQRLTGAGRHEAEAEAEKALAMVGLGDVKRRRTHALSHGMRKRLGIAQAFLGDPEVILLDEPTAGLDPQNARQIRDLITELRSRATVIVSSHNLAEIQELCDRVAILDRGKLVAAGSVDELTRTGQEIELSLSRDLAPGDRDAVEAIEGVVELRDRGAGRVALSLRLEGDRDRDALVASILRALLDRDLVPRSLGEGSTLEEHFLRLVADSSE